MRCQKHLVAAAHKCAEEVLVWWAPEHLAVDILPPTFLHVLQNYSQPPGIQYMTSLQMRQRVAATHGELSEQYTMLCRNPLKCNKNLQG